MINLEICVDNYQSILNAEKSGANRLELCSALSTGGLTPFTSIVNFAKKNSKCSIQAMIRHRSGDFFYDDIDQQLLLEDCQQMLSLGVDGIVIGVITPDYKIDKKFLEPFITMVKSANKELTFHRAIDLVADINISIAEIIELGFDRILTSGADKNVTEGLNTLQNIQQKFGNKIQIMLGGGINSSNLENIIHTTNVTNIHCSASKNILRDTSTSVFSSQSLQIKISQLYEINKIVEIINKYQNI